MRKHWFSYVDKVRKREARKQKKPVSHREAMRIASSTWEKEKLKIQRKMKRDAKQKKTAVKSIPKSQVPATDDPTPSPGL